MTNKAPTKLRPPFANALDEAIADAKRRPMLPTLEQRAHAAILDALIAIEKAREACKATKATKETITAARLTRASEHATKALKAIQPLRNPAWPDGQA